MRLEALAGRRVAILGYGREGHSAARLLTSRARPACLDVFTGDLAAAEGDIAGVGYQSGLPGADVLSGYDVVLRSPGISTYRPPLSELPATGPEVLTGADIWFAEHPGARTVVITGSKGKSTTAALTAHLLRHAGWRVALGGNIGVPLLDLMAPEPEPDVWVIELSSYQIQDLRARPSIAVVLNLFPEHLDWHGSVERYYGDKLSLLEGAGRVVVNGADAELRARVAPGAGVRWYNDGAGFHVEDGRVCLGARPLFGLDAFPLPGAHNRSNLCAALTVLDLLGGDAAAGGAALPDFQPLPHRLHSLGERDGVEYVDDSISTTPHASIAALECYPGRPVTILVGGYDRGLDWGAFAEFAGARPECRIVTFGALGPRIAGLLGEAGLHEAVVTTAGALDAALEAARGVTPRGGVILLSPGAPSFDAFRDYQERGETFGRLVDGAATGKEQPE